MADNEETMADSDNAAELRDTLVRRLVIAAVLVAILLGVLAFFDHMGSVPDEPEAPVFTEPVPVAPRKEVSQPVTPTESLPDELPVDDGMPVGEPPPPPEVEAKPAAGTGVGVESAPAVRRPASATVASPRPPAQPAPVVEETAPPQMVEPPPAPVAPPATAWSFSGFVLQAGVFSSPQLAEELRAKLTLSGVPSSVETRVQVGPFRTRQEAEAAQARLKELGIQTILIAPAGKR